MKPAPTDPRLRQVFRPLKTALVLAGFSGVIYGVLCTLPAEDLFEDGSLAAVVVLGLLLTVSVALAAVSFLRFFHLRRWYWERIAAWSTEVRTRERTPTPELAKGRRDALVLGAVALGFVVLAVGLPLLGRTSLGRAEWEELWFLCVVWLLSAVVIGGWAVLCARRWLEWWQTGLLATVVEYLDREPFDSRGLCLLGSAAAVTAIGLTVANYPDYRDLAVAIGLLLLCVWGYFVNLLSRRFRPSPGEIAGLGLVWAGTTGFTWAMRGALSAGIVAVGLGAFLCFAAAWAAPVAEALGLRSRWATAGLVVLMLLVPAALMTLVAVGFLVYVFAHMNHPWPWECCLAGLFGALVPGLVLWLTWRARKAVRLRPNRLPRTSAP